MKRTVIFVVMLWAMTLGGGLRASAQDQNTEVPGSGKKATSAYRLDLALDELAEGKKINTRHYSMNVTEGDSTQELKIGTRVPVESEPGKFQYLDIGTSIVARLINWTAPVSLNIHADISSLAVADASRAGENCGVHAAPLIRHIIISGTTVLLLDKPIIIGSVDDPNSTHQFQLQVTATKIK